MDETYRMLAAERQADFAREAARRQLADEARRTKVGAPPPARAPRRPGLTAFLLRVARAER